MMRPFGLLLMIDPIVKKYEKEEVMRKELFEAVHYVGDKGECNIVPT
jgi:hypothetical protein